MSARHRRAGRRAIIARRRRLGAMIRAGVGAYLARVILSPTASRDDLVAAVMRVHIAWRRRYGLTTDIRLRPLPMTDEDRATNTLRFDVMIPRTFTFTVGGS